MQLLQAVLPESGVNLDSGGTNAGPSDGRCAAWRQSRRQKSDPPPRSALEERVLTRTPPKVACERRVAQDACAFVEQNIWETCQSVWCRSVATVLARRLCVFTRGRVWERAAVAGTRLITVRVNPFFDVFLSLPEDSTQFLSCGSCG